LPARALFEEALERAADVRLGARELIVEASRLTAACKL